MAKSGRNGGAAYQKDSFTLEGGLEAFFRALEGQNRSPATVRAYKTDLAQFISWLHDNNLIVTGPADVVRADVTEYLSYLSGRELAGVSRARKLAAIREYFRYLVDHDLIDKSPVAGVETSKKERNGRTFLRVDEYNRLLSLAGGNPRDYAILQVFLQTGVRVAELCGLTLEDVDLQGRSLRVSGKGMQTRDIELEKKGVLALKNYLAVHSQSLSGHLFLNRDGDPLGERGVRKLVAKYRRLAGITKKASCHSFRHTFATHKAERGVSPFLLKDWLGHSSVATTQIYVHMARANARKAMEATSL